MVIDEFYEINNGSVVAFREEQVIRSSLKELSSMDLSVWYFVVGHGEHELGSISFSKRLSVLEHAAKQKNREGRSLNGYDTKAIPEDADLIVVFGAKNKFLAVEKAIWRGFIDNRNGKLAFALDGNFDIGLKDFFEDHGIFVGGNSLVPINATVSNYVEDLGIKHFASHKINGRPMEYRIPVIFGATCEVKQTPWFIDNEALARMISSGGISLLSFPKKM